MWSLAWLLPSLAAPCCPQTAKCQSLIKLTDSMFKFDLYENEKVINIYRQTEAVLFEPVLVLFVLIYVPWFFLLKYDMAATYLNWLIFWTVLVFLYGLNKYLLWLINVYIVTTKRIVNINYKTLLNKTVLESPLERILNVSFSVKGFWQLLFQFGSVEVQAIGLSEPIVIKNVPQPSKIKDFLWQVHTSRSNPGLLNNTVTIKNVR